VALSCWQPPPEGVTPREAAAGRYQRDGYMIEPAADFNHRAGYLSVSKTHRDSRFRGSYAFKEVPGAGAAALPRRSGVAWGWGTLLWQQCRVGRRHDKFVLSTLDGLPCAAAESALQS